MRRTVARLAFAALLLFSGCATLPEHYALPGSTQTFTLEEILPQVRNERVVFLGESHASEEDHLVQYEVIKYLHESGKQVAVALEMFPSDMQPLLDRWIGNSLSDDDFKRAYFGVWRVPYEYYGRIFEYAKKARIPLIGINGDQTRIEDVAKKGLAALPAEFRKTIGVTSCEESPLYRKVIELLGRKITHMAEFPFFCDAQRLRDTIMAYNLTGILKRGDYTVIVLAGSVHAMKAAVPRILSAYTGVTGMVLMSKDFIELVFSEPNGDIADYMWY